MMRELLTQEVARIVGLRSLLFSLLLFLPSTVWSQTNWWNLNWNYRIPIIVEPASATPTEVPVAVTINFTVALKAANLRTQFDSSSIQVVEVNSAGSLLDTSVTFQFQHERDYNAAKKAQGKLMFWPKGKTRATRYFHLYFDSNDSKMPAMLASQPAFVERQRIGKKGNSQAHEWEPADFAHDALIINLGKIEINANNVTSRARKIASEPLARPVEVNMAISEPPYKNKPEHKFFGGYCTWYAAKKWKEFTETPVTWSGDGGRWFDNAAEEGRKVSTDPRAAVKGAIIVWTRAGAAGHVAFVEDVDDDGIYISEMNAKGLWVVSDAYLPFTNLDKGTKYKFRGYILPE